MKRLSLLILSIAVLQPIVSQAIGLKQDGLQLSCKWDDEHGVQNGTTGHTSSGSSDSSSSDKK